MEDIDIEKLTIGQAIDLSIIKWKYIFRNGFNKTGLIKQYPILKNLIALCGLCQYAHQGNTYDTCPDNLREIQYANCVAKCPFCKHCNNIPCDYNTLYQDWTIKKDKATAKPILDILIQLKENTKGDTK